MRHRPAGDTELPTSAAHLTIVMEPHSYLDPFGGDQLSSAGNLIVQLGYVRVLRERESAAHAAAGLQGAAASGYGAGGDATGSVAIPVTIYLSRQGAHRKVEAALEAFLIAAGFQVESRDDPIIGSWFRRMLVTLKDAAASEGAREAALVAAHVADTRLVLAQDAAVTAMLLQNLGPVLGALQPTKDAILRTGALLIVKVDWVVHVYQLTAAQQARLDHQPQLARSPHEIVAALNLMPEDRHRDDPPALEG